jgi:MYXO-CTERM domain-containing protein
MRIMRSALIIAAGLLTPSIAFAHASLVYPSPRTTELKTGPCGAAGSVRGTNVTTLTAGSTIKVKWTETIEHPGHYRISFDPDGQDFYTPQSFVENTEGQLNVIDDLIPDIAGTAPHAYELDITLPNMECTNCTLQMIQMMTDKAPYTLPPNSDDIYYQCADITLTSANTAPDAGMVTTPDAGDMGSGSGSGNPEISGGCSTGNGAGLLALVGLVGLLRRRRN